MDPECKEIYKHMGLLTSLRQRYTLWDFYQQYWLPFGELLTDMEREGFLVDRCGETVL